MGTYFSILKGGGGGNRKSGEIAAALNVRQTGLSKYLKVLERLDVLERVVPVTEEEPRESKKGLLLHQGQLPGIWFRARLSQMETGGKEALKTILSTAGRLLPRPPVGCGRGRGAALHWALVDVERQTLWG